MSGSVAMVPVIWSKLTTTKPQKIHKIPLAFGSILATVHRSQYTIWCRCKYKYAMILVAIITLQVAQAASSAIASEQSDTLAPMVNNRLLNQQKNIHSSNVARSPAAASAGLGPSKDSATATIDDQDQSTYQKVPVGRSVTFKCGVKNIGKHRLSWIHKDRHTVLAFSDKVVLNNGRIKVSSQADTVFYLHIDNVQLTDKGQIMCQLNTNPMRSQIHTLDIVESPRIIDHLTSSNLEPIKEGSNVSLRCGATGLPTPDISWRRETDRTRLVHLSSNSNATDGLTGSSYLANSSHSSLGYDSQAPETGTRIHSDIHSSEMHVVKSGTDNAAAAAAAAIDTNNSDNYRSSNHDNKTITVQGQYLNITRVDRRDMGFYVCIASNGVPTSVSRRIFLPVSFGPMLTPSKHQRVRPSGRDIVLYCDLESYPKSTAHWTFNGRALFEPQLLSQSSKNLKSSSRRSNYELKYLARSDSNTVKVARSASLATGLQLELANAERLADSDDSDADDKYEMSIIDDVDNYNYKSILMLKIKDFQQTDYGVYICAAKNNFGEAQAKINVLPKDYTRLVPIVTAAASVPQNMILSQHRLHHQQQQNNHNNGSANGKATNIFTVNGVKYIQIGAASSVSLAPSPNSNINNNNNNRIDDSSAGHDLKSDINSNGKFNPSAMDRNRQREATSNNRMVAKPPMNDNHYNHSNNIDSGNDKLDASYNAADNDDNHLDLRLDLNDNNNSLDLQLLHQSSSSSSSSSLRPPLILLRSLWPAYVYYFVKLQQHNWWPCTLHYNYLRPR